MVLHKKISIVMGYYNRKDQTILTLDNFERLYHSKYDFEVIVVDDNSDENNNLSDIIKKYSFAIKYITISKEEKGRRINPCSAYNKGFMMCESDIIIIQNPECYHVGDIIGHTLTNLKESNYITYSCYTANSHEITKELIESENIYNTINDKQFKKKNSKINGLEWYNHPLHRRTGYHFCSAIYKSNLELIGGFDKRFAYGYCYDDDEFVATIKYVLKLEVEIVPPEHCFVIHQYHEKGEYLNIDREHNENIIKQKWLLNKMLYENILKSYTETKFKYPKLLHMYWSGSNFGYLNYLTIMSFNNYHKNWKIIIYTPKVTIDKFVEEQDKSKCHFEKIKSINNVTLKYICFEEIGFRNDVTDIFKSNYLRYYVLQKHGGVWADMDILFTASIEEKMNFDEDIVMFQCKSYENPKNKEKSKYSLYYPVGFFISIPNNKFFKYLSDNTKKYYHSNNVQSIGTSMLFKLFSEKDKLHKNNNFMESIKICDNEYYLPWAWNELEEIYNKKDNILPSNNVGVYWFSGTTEAIQYVNELDNRINMGLVEPKCYMDKLILKY